MSILSFLDTVYDTAQHSQRYGTPGTMIQGDSRYDYNTLRYPLDIGSADKGHYVVIHINTQQKTQFNPSGYSWDDPTVIANMRKMVEMRGRYGVGGAAQTATAEAGKFLNSATKLVGEIRQDVLSNQYAGPILSGAENLSKTFGTWVDNNTNGSISGASDFAKAFGGSLSSATQNFKSELLRTITRTTDSITLYMPSTLTFDYRQSYQDLSLNSGMGSLATAGASLYDAYKGGANRLGEIAAPFAASYVLGKFGDFGRALAAGGLGVVENPMLELIYSQPNFRTFQFDFMLYPRDEKEALEVQKILERLRFHQAPEVKDSTYGYFLVPPSEFDIQFYYNGKVNPNIDPVSTCVLEQITVNYVPTGEFTAYESVGQNTPKLGSTGMPVAIQLTLMFKETQIKFKELMLQKQTSNGQTAQALPVDISSTITSRALPPLEESWSEK